MTELWQNITLQGSACCQNKKFLCRNSEAKCGRPGTSPLWAAWSPGEGGGSFLRPLAADRHQHRVHKYQGPVSSSWLSHHSDNPPPHPTEQNVWHLGSDMTQRLSSVSMELWPPACVLQRKETLKCWSQWWHVFSMLVVFFKFRNSGAILLCTDRLSRSNSGSLRSWALASGMGGSWLCSWEFLDFYTLETSGCSWWVLLSCG